jgi:predicted ATPase
MDNIKIKGFKSIKEIDLTLNPINILIGANGSGKSNFISFFEFLNFLHNKNLKEYVSIRGGEDKFLFEGSEKTEEISFETSFDEGVNGYSAELELSSSGFVFKNEHLIFNKDKGRNINNYGEEANIKTTDNYRAKYVIKYLESYRKYHFHDTSRNSPFTKMSHITNDSFFLYEDGKNLASFLYNTNENDKVVYNRIISTIQSVAPYFSDFYLKPNKEGHLRLQWQDKYGSTIYGANDFSDGTIRFIALATLFLQSDLPSTIIIDEPELGLHPFAISKLAGMIRSASSRDSQVIIATQSSDLVNHFNPDEVITVDQINGESKFKRLSKEDLAEWLDDYSIGELWQRNIIHGGQPI